MSREEEVGPLLFGEAPSRKGDRYWRFPFHSKLGKRICNAMGWDIGTLSPYWALREHFQLANAIERHGDAVPWNTRLARERCQRLIDDRLAEGQRLVVVCFGRRAAEAAGMREPRLGVWARIDRFTGPVESLEFFAGTRARIEEVRQKSVDELLRRSSLGSDASWQYDAVLASDGSESEEALRRVLTEAIGRLRI